MAISWSSRRQLLYYTVAIIVSIIILALGYKLFLTHAPTCSDGIQNGTELGVDCGGACSLICANTAHVPRVLWSRSFQTDKSLYTAAAYVENLNPGAGARNVHYTFRLYDKDNIFVAGRDGVIDIPPMALVPIVEPNIDIGTREVAFTRFEFDGEPVWNKVSSPLPTIHVGGQNLTSDGTRLSATLKNDSVQDIGRVNVVAVLFDREGVARAASKTTVSKIARKSSESIVFTWPTPVLDIVRAEMTVIPTF